MSADGTKKLTQKIDELVKALNLTNRVLARLVVWKDENLKDKSLALLKMGFRPIDVAAILGVQSGSVTKARSRAEGRTKH